MADVVKGIEIIDEASTLEKFEDKIRSKGLSVYQVGSDKIVYSIGDTEEQRESLNNALEENAFVLNLDYARAKLLYVNKVTGQVRESKKLMEQFVSNDDTDDVEDISEGVPVSLLPELVEFVGENPTLAEEDISAAFNTDELEEETAEVVIHDETEKEEPTNAFDDFDDEFVDDVEEQPQQEIEKEDIQEIEKEDILEDFVEEEPEVEPEKIENENKDYLMEKAIALFDAQHPMSLPQFDELTHKELQKQVIESQFTVSKARDKGINAIYNRLKNEATESFETIKTNVIESARQKHEEVLNRIDRNYKYDVEKILNEHNAEYEKDRENFIQSQIPVLRKKYDAKHSPDYESVLTAEIDRMREQSENEMNEERERFKSYVDNVLNDSKEKAISAVRVEDIIAEYNKVAEEQKELLLLDAKNKKKEIGSTLSEIVKERDHLKSEINDFQKQLENQKESEQERISSGVSVALEEKEQEIRKESKAKLDKTYDKERKLIAQIEQLENALASEKEEKNNRGKEYIEPAQEEAAASRNGIAGNHSSFVHSEAEPSKFGKIKFYVGCGVSLLFIIVFSVGVFTLSDIKKEMVKGNNLDQSSYLAQLEADERYDKTASEMQAFGYGKESIAEMYLENDQYILALKTDKGVLPDVYTFAESAEDKEAQKNILENMKKNVSLDDEHLNNGLDVRIAILNDNAEAIDNLAFEKKVDKDSAKEIVKYYMDKKDFDTAEKSLKTYPDEKLSEKLEEARTTEAKEKVGNLQEEIKGLEKVISDSDKKGVDLKENLDKAKKSKDEKGIKKQIKENDEHKAKSEKELEAKQADLVELEKEL